MQIKSALTPAQKQKAYRERQRENAQNNNGNVTIENLNLALEQELETVGFHEMNTEQKAQFSAHILLKMIPELANKELLKALFVIVMTDHNLN